MSLESSAFSLSLFLIIALMLVIPALRKLPGLGVLPVILLIAIVVGQRGDIWASLGLERPDSWGRTLALGFVFGTLIALFSTAVIEPISEKLTGSQHDLSALGPIRGELRATITWIAAAWLIAATLEEIIFRGFMMRELARLLGTGFLANAVNLIATSIVFGFAHWYQSQAGALSTGLVSVLLGALFIWNDFQLWLLVVTHGVIDTVGLLLIYAGWDKRLKNLCISTDKTTIDLEIPSDGDGG